jgi:hypothetical protein
VNLCSLRLVISWPFPTHITLVHLLFKGGFNIALSWIPGYGSEAADATSRGNLIPGISDLNYRTGFCHSVLATPVS